MQFIPYSFFKWWQDSSVSRLVGDGMWTFAVIETIHIMAFTVLLGTVFVVDMRLLGFGLRRQPSARIAKYLAPWTWGTLAVVAVSGFLLFASEATKLFHSPPFLWKLDILIFAVGVHLLTCKMVIAEVVHEGSAWTKMGAWVLLLCWFSVALAGRAIAFV